MDPNNLNLEDLIPEDDPVRGGTVYYDPQTYPVEKSEVAFIPWEDDEDQDERQDDTRRESENEEKKQSKEEGENQENGTEGHEETENTGELGETGEIEGTEGAGELGEIGELGEGAEMLEAGELVGAGAEGAGLAAAGGAAVSSEAAVGAGVAVATSETWVPILAVVLAIGVVVVLASVIVLALMGDTPAAATPNSGTGSTTVATAGLCQPLKPGDPSSSKQFVALPRNSGDYGINGGSPASQQWGSPELVSLLIGLAHSWAVNHPNNKISIGDLSLQNGGHYGGHVSHAAGMDVDLNSDNSPYFVMSKSPYDRAQAIELGKMLMDTGAIVKIFYNDTAVQSAVNAYASSKNIPGRMETWPNHANHFHVRMEPALYDKTCGYQESVGGTYGDNELKRLGQFVNP